MKFFLLTALLLLNSQTEGRGKTYDDVDKILRDDTGYRIHSRTDKVNLEEENKPVDK